MEIQFNWEDFRAVQLSAAEEKIIEAHFTIYLEGNRNEDDPMLSSLELQEKYNTFKSSWIMSQMFTDGYKNK